MELDSIFSQLPKLIEGWDPPSSMPVKPSKRIQEAIPVSMLNGEVSAVPLGDSIQSDLDSHANMIGLGKHCFIISYSGKYIDVKMPLLMLLVVFHKCLLLMPPLHMIAPTLIIRVGY
jgi:hypothetical protein